MSLFKTITVKHIIPNWSKIPVGSKFTATIEGIAASGRIQKEKGLIYLCQNTSNGSNCTNKLGFPYSYCLQKGDAATLSEEEVVFKSITLDPKFIAPPVIKAGGYLVTFQRGKIKVGCKTISNTVVKQIFDNLKK